MVTRARTKPESVDGARTHRENRTGQEKHAGEGIENNESHRADPTALLNPLQRAVKKFCPTHVSATRDTTLC